MWKHGDHGTAHFYNSGSARGTFAIEFENNDVNRDLLGPGYTITLPKFSGNTALTGLVAQVRVFKTRRDKRAMGVACVVNHPDEVDTSILLFRVAQFFNGLTIDHPKMEHKVLVAFDVDVTSNSLSGDDEMFLYFEPVDVHTGARFKRKVPHDKTAGSNTLIQYANLLKEDAERLVELNDNIFNRYAEFSFDQEKIFIEEREAILERLNLVAA